jgi:hypothetical protein
MEPQPATLVHHVVHYGCMTVLLAGSAVGIIFLPLGLSIIEGWLFDTMYVEDFFRHIHLHAPLGNLYEPLIAWLRELFQESS